MNIWSGEISDFPKNVLKTAKMTASTVLEGINVNANPLHLDEIPYAMDKMGWSVSAKMMRRWFDTKPAYAMPAFERAGNDQAKKKIDYSKLHVDRIDNSIITMDWLLKFPSVREVCKILLANWANPSGVARMKEVLLPAVGWIPGKTAYLGSRKSNAIGLEMSSQVNSRRLGAYTDTLDDLYGAIFKATMKIAVVGRAYYSNFHQADIFEVDILGIYLRDTYDFNAEAHFDRSIGLGVWSRDRLLSKLEMTDYLSATMVRRALFFPDFVPVRNEDFSRWRNAQGTGGDFYVFSDVLWQLPLQRNVRL